jgi:zinc transporter ZupT
MAIAVSIGTFISTLLGGLFALYLQDRLHLILGFSAGTLIGVAFFDLLPELLDLASPAVGGQIVATVIATGFVGYMLLDRTIAPHGDKGRRTEKLWQRGALGAGSLSAHSFLDGFAIGLAFKVSAAVGAIVSGGTVRWASRCALFQARRSPRDRLIRLPIPIMGNRRRQCRRCAETREIKFSQV